MANDDELDKALGLLFKEQHAVRAPLSGPIIKEMVKILMKKLKPYEKIDFEASNGWFWHWQKQHGIGWSVTHKKRDQISKVLF